MQSVSPNKKKIKVRLVDIHGAVTITSLRQAEKYVRRGKARQLDIGDFEMISHRRQAGMTPGGAGPRPMQAWRPEVRPSAQPLGYIGSVLAFWPDERSLAARKVKRTARAMDEIRSLFSDAEARGRTERGTGEVRTDDTLREVRRLHQQTAGRRARKGLFYWRDET